MLATPRPRHHNLCAAAAGRRRRPGGGYRHEDACCASASSKRGTVGNADVAEPANIGRIARSCSQLPAGSEVLGDFDRLAIQQRYRAVDAENTGSPFPAGIDDRGAT